MHPRLKILSEINKLEDNYCESCSYKNTSDYCRTECEISNQLKNLGEMLIVNKAKDSRKPKYQSNIDIYYKQKEVEPVENKLTKEILIKLKAEGNSDTKIRKMYGMGNGSFYKFKNECGLVGDNGSGRPKNVFKSNAVAKVEITADPIKGIPIKNINVKSVGEKVFTPQINPNVLLGFAEEKIKKLEEIILEKANPIISAKNSEIADTKSIIDNKIIDLEDKLLEKDKKIESLETFKEEYYTNYCNAMDSLEALHGEYEEILSEKDAVIRNLHNLRSEDVLVIDDLIAKYKSALKERDALNEKYVETFNNLSSMKGELNRINNQPKQCSCPDKTNHLEAKIMRLESELTSLRNDKEFLADHIRKIGKYKHLYFSTVETLKLHLPN